MQAIRVDRKRSLDPRWFRHLSLLSAVAMLFGWVVIIRSPAGADLGDRLPVGFLPPPSSPAQEWRPVRVPVRTSAPRDPSPPFALSPPPIDVAAVAAVGAAEQWVQAHRPAALFAAPGDGAGRELEVPQWSYLRVLETGDGWLRVAYGRDAEGRPANMAWIAVADVGLSGPPPTFAMTTRDAELWGSADGAAGRVATAPGLATFQLAGSERDGRVAVRLDGGAEPVVAWVDREAIASAPAPVERDVPLAATFSPYSLDVRLDVPYRTQLDGSLSAGSNCGPTSVAMILEAFGVWIPTAQARSLALRQMGISSPFSGTTLESLRAVAEAHGLVGLDLQEHGRYKRWTLDDVRRHVRAGHPVIPQLRYRLMPGRGWTWVGYDHYVVVSGLVGDDFIIDDPVPQDGQGERVISARELERAWMNSDVPFGAVAIARPL